MHQQSSQVLFKFVLRPLFLSPALYDRTTWRVCTRRKLRRRQSDFSARLYRGNLSRRSNAEPERRGNTSPFHYVITSSSTSVTTTEISKAQCRASHLRVMLPAISLFASSHVDDRHSYLRSTAIAVENACGTVSFHSYQRGNSLGNER